MAIAYVTSVSASSGNNSTVTTGSMDSTGGNLIVLVCGTSKSPGLAATISDSKGNTYTGLTTPDGPGTASADLRGTLRYVLNPTVGSGHTVSITGSSSSFPGVAASVYSGVKATSAFDVESAGAFTTVTTSVSAGTLTPSEDNCLIVAGFTSNNTNTPTGPSGFNSRQNRALVSGNAYGVSLWDQIQTTATARNPDWSWTSNNNDTVAIAAAFKAEPAAGGFQVAFAQRCNTFLGYA